ncbi:hypothetical protein ACFE04_005497 [Oxalis oulophora]
MIINPTRLSLPAESPNRDQLLRRGMSVPSFCPVCGSGVENIAHLFLSCHWVVKLRRLSFPGFNSLVFANENFENWYYQMKSMLAADVMWIFGRASNLASKMAWIPK